MPGVLKSTLRNYFKYTVVLYITVTKLAYVFKQLCTYMKCVKSVSTIR